jgi:hypothetical protein
MRAAASVERAPQETVRPQGPPLDRKRQLPHERTWCVFRRGGACQFDLGTCVTRRPQDIGSNVAGQATAQTRLGRGRYPTVLGDSKAKRLACRLLARSRFLEVVGSNGLILQHHQAQKPLGRKRHSFGCALAFPP